LILAFHKPCGVLSQFTRDGSPNRPLAEFGFPAGVYPLGRLDADSEGLLLLSDEPRWNERLLAPGRHVEKTYLALVERLPDASALQNLREGILLEGRRTLPAAVLLLEPQPCIPARVPPVRIRKTVQDFWIELRISEGRNRQVRRMTAAVGHPLIRLIRVGIGGLSLDKFALGEWRRLEANEAAQLLDQPAAGRQAYMQCGPVGAVPIRP
jgi:23S rRNA pseudouridine2457 synthase